MNSLVIIFAIFPCYSFHNNQNLDPTIVVIYPPLRVTSNPILNNPTITFRSTCADNIYLNISRDSDSPAAEFTASGDFTQPITKYSESWISVDLMDAIDNGWRGCFYLSAIAKTKFSSQVSACVGLDFSQSNETAKIWAINGSYPIRVAPNSTDSNCGTAMYQPPNTICPSGLNCNVDIPEQCLVSTSYMVTLDSPVTSGD